MTAEDIDAFGFTIFVPVLWEALQDRRRDNDFIVQYYNPTHDPTGGGGLSALLNTHATWNAVRTSSIRFEFGGVTERLFQVFHGFNDVAWMDLNAPHALAIWTIRHDPQRGCFHHARPGPRARADL